MRRKWLVSPGEVTADACWVDARSGAPGRSAYVTGHVRGAVHVDLDAELAAPALDPSHGGRHPLPTPQAFAELLGRLAIGPATFVVVYDDQGGANAASRLWWMLRAVGHERVVVLDGGFAAAVHAAATKTGLPIENGVSTVAPIAAPAPRAWALPLADIEEVARAAHDPKHMLLDVRAAARFRGELEPIDPVAGHIPGAANLFYGDHLGADGRFLSAAELRDKYRTLFGDVPADNVIVHCGSGVTACHTLLALEVAGLSGAKLYVGSWGEWCRDEARPRAVGDDGRGSLVEPAAD